MSTMMAEGRKSANSEGARSCTKTGKSLPSISSVMRVARALWPSKTAMALAERTGASERLCKYWLANRYDMSAEHLASLLRSDEGMQVLEAVMGDCKPVWWKRMKASAHRAALRRAQKDLQRQIDQMELELE